MIVLMTGVIGFNTPLNPLSRGERDTPCLYKLALSGKSGLPRPGRASLPVLAGLSCRLLYFRSVATATAVACMDAGGYRARFFQQ